MAYTFGAATTDRINLTLSSNYHTTGNIQFVGGWFYPTTLTAGRGYFGFNAALHLTVAPTTSELRFTTPQATTAGVFDTSGAGIVTNLWQFIMVAWPTNNTGPISTPRIWLATAQTPPTELTVATTTAPVGNATGSASLAIGNTGAAASLAFQGDIGYCFGAISTSASNHFGWHETATAVIPTNEADMIRNRIAVPTWQGSFPGKHFKHSANSSIEMWMLNMDTNGWAPFHRRQIGATAPAIVSQGTISGATFSQARQPFPLDVNSMYFDQAVA